MKIVGSVSFAKPGGQKIIMVYGEAASRRAYVGLATPRTLLAEDIENIVENGCEVKVSQLKTVLSYLEEKGE